MKSLLLILACLLTTTAQAADPVFLHAAFDGSTAATLNGAALAAAKDEKATITDGALVIGSGTALEYDLGAGLPGAAGSLELRFRPGFPQRPEGERRTAFSLVGEEGERLDFEFEPQGTMWRFGTQFPGWQRQLSAAYFNEEHEQRWTHLVLTWDEKVKPAPVLRLYRDGKWVRSQTEAYRASLSALRRLVITGAAQVRIDEIVIYREALTAADVAALHEGFGKTDRLAAWQTRRQEETLLSLGRQGAHLASRPAPARRGA